jgi:Zn-dependent protease
MGLIISLAIFFSAVILHEYAHGWVAYKLGDPTAKYAGRLTLNPLEHIDPVGTLLMPLILIVMKSPVIFGWAKPVPVNFWNLHNPRRDMIWVGLAGPMTNLLLAAGLSLFLRLGLPAVVVSFLNTAIIINLVFAVFNLIPIPPLDGSRVVSGLLPRQLAIEYNRLERFGIIIIFALLYLGIFNAVIWPIVEVIAGFLGVNALI